MINLKLNSEAFLFWLHECVMNVIFLVSFVPVVSSKASRDFRPLVEEVLIKITDNTTTL